MVTLVVESGLCNRMRAISSAVTLCQRLETELRVVWVLNAALNCRFEQLFKNIPNVKMIQVGGRFANLRSWIFWLHYDLRHALRWGSRFLNNNEFKAVYAAGGLEAIISSPNHLVIETNSWFQPPPIDHSALQPVQSVLDLVAEVLSANPGPFIGVHVRRTDNKKAIAESPDESFISAMAKELRDESSARFFVATDDLVTEKKLTEAFSDRVWVRKKQLSRESETAIIDALCDLLILSRSTKLLGSYWSSFTDTAAELGNVPLSIVRKAANETVL